MSIAQMNVESSPNLGFALRPQSQLMVTTASGGHRPHTLDDALNSLIQSMTDDQGNLNNENPLVKLLAACLQQGSRSTYGPSQGSGASGREESATDQLKEVLSKMLDEVQGKSASMRDNSGGSGQDIVGKLLSSLVENKLDNILQPSGNGAATFSPQDSALMNQIAHFMDQHPEIFGSPDDANGTTRSWSDEVGEDNTLNSDEAGAFQQAIQMITQSDGIASGARAAGGNQASYMSNQGNNQGLGRVSSGGGSDDGDELPGSNISITMSADEFLELMKAVQGNAPQGNGPTAQSQSLNEDASQAAAAIINAMLS